MAALLRANPWVVESDSALPPPAAIRIRYRTRMRNPRKLWELLTGRINVTKIWQGLKAAQGGGLESALAKDMARALSDTRRPVTRSEEHTSELQSLMRISYAVFCLKKTEHIYRTIELTNQVGIR